jgi:hypothetical protein
MNTYRCYRIEASTGRFLDFKVFDASDDNAARQEALRIARDRNWRNLELWHGGRRIVLPDPLEQEP